MFLIFNSHLVLNSQNYTNEINGISIIVVHCVGNTENYTGEVK